MTPDADWHLWIDDRPRPGALNMAIDQALLDLADSEGLSSLRIYRWEPFCLSFGRHEPASRRYDRTLIEARHLDAVRRPTGGRAVWHARELTYAVAAPAVRFGSLPAAYLAIHRIVADAVAALGGSPSLAPPGRTAPLDAGACFASPAGGEVMLNGRKVAGSAQVRHGTALLQHGSLLLDDDQRMVTEISLGAAPAGLDASLNSLLPIPCTFDTAAAALVAAAQRAWRGPWHTVMDPARVLSQAALHHTRFASADWTWRR